MSIEDRPYLLCVDDDSSVLAGLARGLHRHFHLETLSDPRTAVEFARRCKSLAVVVSDLRMPDMDGIAFLSKVREVSPDTVRILLTGNCDLEAAIAAVNQGHIFRFLTKPCPLELMLPTLKAAVEQYRLVTGERILLEQTLQGSVQTLANILALVHPAAFGRATRARERVRELLDHFRIAERWPVEVAALLSQIGCVTLPPQTAEKMYNGEALNESEQEMVGRLPKITEDLLANIPRLEPVRAILRSHLRRFDNPAYSAVGTEAAVTWAGNALKIVLDYDALEGQKILPADALRTMRGRTGWYDPVVFEAFAEMCSSRDKTEFKELPLREIQVGMIFADDVKALGGLLLIGRGQEVTTSLLERIRNLSSVVGVREPIRVIVR